MCQILVQDPQSSLYWNKSLQRDICGPVGRLIKVHTTTRPDHVWPDVWTRIGKAAQKKEKQEWANEKPKLDNARRMRGIYFIDREDEGFKETIKYAKRKLEVHMDAAMPSKKKTKKLVQLTGNCSESRSCAEQKEDEKRVQLAGNCSKD